VKKARHWLSVFALALLACGDSPGPAANPGEGGAQDAAVDGTDAHQTSDATAFDGDAEDADSSIDATDACSLATCSVLGATCGTPDDGCGGLLSCGNCPLPQTCGGGGLPYACGPEATLADYWAGNAAWHFEFALTLENTGWPYGYGAGAHLEVHDGAWYLFGRRVGWGVHPPQCPFEPLTTEVRRSIDHGETWSDPVEILKADPGTPWECAATDGDAFFEAASSTWHYLYQCLAGSGGWKACHAHRSAPDPMGMFTPAASPALQPGQLWNAICDVGSDDCSQLAGGPGKVFDEGTFDVFHHDGSYYYVGFHGFDGVRGYRGIAKTPDFVSWVAGDPAQGVPADAVVDVHDAAGWRESWQPGGNIGAGAGCILEESGTWYLLVEAADINLGCTAGQNWDFGIFRSTALTATTWEQLPRGNPILYSSKQPETNGTSLPCNIQYAKLFRDDGVTWMHVTRESLDPAQSGIYFYRLEPTANRLRNGDLWMCTTDGWSALPVGPTNLVAYRFPGGSTDANCYLATNCGQPTCAAGQSVYQDADVSDLNGTTVAFGGKFMAEGGSGSIDLVVHELDAASNILATHTETIGLGDAYAPVEGQFTTAPGAVTARFQIYLVTALTVRADEMYLQPVAP